MLRFLLTTTAVVALALPVTAQDAEVEQDAEVGQEYEITIAGDVPAAVETRRRLG